MLACQPTTCVQPHATQPFLTHGRATLCHAGLAVCGASLQVQAWAAEVLAQLLSVSPPQAQPSTLARECVQLACGLAGAAQAPAPARAAAWVLCSLAHTLLRHQQQAAESSGGLALGAEEELWQLLGGRLLPAGLQLLRSCGPSKVGAW